LVIQSHNPEQEEAEEELEVGYEGEELEIGFNVNYLLDGINITNPGYGFLGIDTNQLDIADFNVKKAGISAEFGRTSGAMFNAVTRSGTGFGTFYSTSPRAVQAERKYTTKPGKTYNGMRTWGSHPGGHLFGYVWRYYSDNAGLSLGRRHVGQPTRRRKATSGS
jgi:hypothetical protein